MLLTVLMLTAFPAFRGLERTTKRHRAIAEADALAQAALAYRRVYGQWPLESEANVAGESFVYIAGDDKQELALIISEDPHQEMAVSQYPLEKLIQALRGGESPHNPRRTRFLEVADNQLNDEGMLIDPWNQPYVLLMGRTKHEGGVAGEVKRVQPPATVSIDTPEDVVAFSWGDPAIPDAQERVIGSWSKR